MQHINDFIILVMLPISIFCTQFNTANNIKTYSLVEVCTLMSAIQTICFDDAGNYSD